VRATSSQLDALLTGNVTAAAVIASTKAAGPPYTTRVAHLAAEQSWSTFSAAALYPLAPLLGSVPLPSASSSVVVVRDEATANFSR
jgi:hypothetical protein